MDVAKKFSSFSRRSKIDQHFEPSLRDEKLYTRTLELAADHDSSGSYSMVAAFYNPKLIAVGYNDLTNPALLKNNSYPYGCGMHAELDLWSTLADGFSGGVVVVAGVNTKSRNEMANTIPCWYCAEILARVRWIICAQNSKVVKVRPTDLSEHKAKKNPFVLHKGSLQVA